MPEPSFVSMWAKRLELISNQINVITSHGGVSPLCSFAGPTNQRQKKTVGIADWKFFTHREIYASFYKIYPDSLESFQTILTVSRESGKFPDSLESFWIFWNVPGQSRKFQDSLENFLTIWKVSRQSGKFSDNLDSF